ncbi:isoprenylcysteine carboxyl methyltransferase family protein [Desulfovibrio sp. A2]|nr:isoprenylcysteine carboxyl methyltransferase family protein [Desulfovibrio sp. A2]
MLQTWKTLPHGGVAMKHESLELAHDGSSSPPSGDTGETGGHGREIPERPWDGAVQWGPGAQENGTDVTIPHVAPTPEDERADGAGQEELSLWGAGPRIVVPALLAQLGGAGLTLALPGPFGMEMLPHWAWVLMGLCALLLGTLTVRRAWAELKPGRQEGRLVTHGPYRITRNPIYAGWILGILPGIALCFASWPMLAGPVVAWALFRETIVVEESFLAARFGEEWDGYAMRVNRLWPNPFRTRGG